MCVYHRISEFFFIFVGYREVGVVIRPYGGQRRPCDVRWSMLQKVSARVVVAKRNLVEVCHRRIEREIDGNYVEGVCFGRRSFAYVHLREILMADLRYHDSFSDLQTSVRR